MSTPSALLPALPDPLPVREPAPRGLVRTARLLAVGVRLHLRYQTRSALALTFAVLVPLVQATLAVYLFRGAGHQVPLLQAAVGAGLMGVWGSVLFGSGGAVQNQRWLGTLESLVLAPAPLALVLLPITLATALTGAYAMVATVLWGRLLYGIPLHLADPIGFAAAVPGCVLALGLTGMLLASTFVLLRNANALANPLDTPIWLLSGLLVPMTVLPQWTRPLSWALPSTWGAQAVRDAAVGGPVWTPLGLALLTGTGYLLLALLALRTVERRARAAATLALS